MFVEGRDTGTVPALERGRRLERKTRKRGEECDSEDTEAPKSASVSGLFMCLQGDGEGSAKHELYTPAQGAQNRKHEADRNRY